jgi:hypothetical protein
VGDDQVDIPGSPAMEFFKIKVGGSQHSLRRMQGAIDALTRKARQRRSFTREEKDFLIEMFEAFSWGGWFQSYSEASKLANHYVHGEGARLAIDSEVYETSVIVQDVERAMKREIEQRFALGAQQGALVLRSDDHRLGKRKDFAALMRNRGRSTATQGVVLDGKLSGWLLTEQNNQRLQKANNRFLLSAVTQKVGKNSYSTTWRVDDEYKFENFDKGFVTDIHVAPKLALKVPDGLCAYMVSLGIAKDFLHFAEWREQWDGSALPVSKAARP